MVRLAPRCCDQTTLWAATTEIVTTTNVELNLQTLNAMIIISKQCNVGPGEKRNPFGLEFVQKFHN